MANTDNPFKKLNLKSGSTKADFSKCLPAGLFQHRSDMCRCVLFPRERLEHTSFCSLQRVVNCPGSAWGWGWSEMKLFLAGASANSLQSSREWGSAAQLPLEGHPKQGRAGQRGGDGERPASPSSQPSRPGACAAAHLGVIVEVPEVQAPHSVHAGKERGMHGGPHDIVHIVCIVFKGVERLVVL